MTRRTEAEKIFYYSQPAIYQRKIEQMENAEERVIWLLKHDNHLRNCDKCLIFHYWLKVDKLELDDNLRMSIVHRLTPAETIRRVRAKIQNKLNLFLPTDADVIKKRDITEQAVRDWARTETAVEERLING